MKASIIPENLEGNSLDIQEQVIEESIEKAIKTFKRASSRLVNPPIWHLLAGPLSAKFILYSSGKEDPKKLAAVGDYFMIDIPGPGTSIGEGYDWVRVEALEQGSESGCDESLAMRLRASYNPKKPNGSIAHFFNDKATATFVIRRIGNLVAASYHGRNEIVNTERISLPEKLRNKVIAATAEAGLSHLQWGSLLKGLLQPEIGG